MVASVVNSSFNSRTLGRVRQEYPQLQLFAIGVSIHAPWEGCDVRPACPSRQRARFNSRTLGRVRQVGKANLEAIPRFNSRTLGRVRHAHTAEAREYSQFQFTHPGKGATTSQSHRLDSVSVSIHAPWEGCDAIEEVFGEFGIMFQFTHPGKGATQAHQQECKPLGGFNSRTLGRVRQRPIPVCA